MVVKCLIDILLLAFPAIFLVVDRDIFTLRMLSNTTQLGRSWHEDLITNAGVTEWYYHTTSVLIRYIEACCVYLLHLAGSSSPLILHIQGSRCSFHHWRYAPGNIICNRALLLRPDFSTQFCWMHPSQAFSEPWQVVNPINSSISHPLKIFSCCRALGLSKILIIISCTLYGHQTASFLLEVIRRISLRLMRLILWFIEDVTSRCGLFNQLFLEGSPVNLFELSHLEWLLSHHVNIMNVIVLLEPNSATEILQVWLG